jgi:hypothetical protein
VGDKAKSAFDAADSIRVNDFFSNHGRLLFWFFGVARLSAYE